MKKIHKYHNLLGFIYALIMLMPFASVLLRCCYVIFNKNAYLSYSDTISSTTIQLNSSNVADYYVDGQLVTINKNTELSFSSRSGIFGFSSISFDANELANTSGVDYVGFEFYTSSSSFWYLIDSNGLNHNISKDLMPTIWSYVVDTSVYQRTSIYSYYVSTIFVPTKGSLDNAFDYSLYSFLNDNGTGNLNLTDWFTDLFLNRSTHNMLYLNYINWYMNYALLISCVYLLFSVLMWFLTYARRLLSKGFNDTSF